ncbi:GNAT family N-acetyltransferase [Janthinobacterium fluminis]|uniref:GNAT family N-acetyltransferase n=1 Tax=Janthinobacterium fluminis TaxID=2987524 RepID=A0ABT5JU21_9BURK|nr:GNAT family N-acetyltransferase [Janthinobacterium fluminis]MDC8755991.1 GNAT family N-acetyltransferase [Janthinobacterium fluminis]
MLTLPAPLHLRSIRDDDQAFLDALYDSTRADLKQAGGDPVFVEQLIKMQQKMQAHGYRIMFPDAQYLLLESDGKPIGRIVLDRDARSVRLVDIAILPTEQGRGVGRTVLSSLQCWAAERQMELRLSVSKDNGKSRRQYLALGFEVTSSDSVHEQMRWSATVNGPAPLTRA